VFDRIGLPAAAGIINFVVLTAALSSCNSGIFSTGRMLLTLARRRHAPRRLGRISSRGVPAVGLFVSFVVMLIGVGLNYFVPEKAFAYVTSMATVNGIFTWVMILLAHLGYRRALAAGRVRESSFKMPGAPVTNWAVLIFLAVVVVLLAFDDDTRVALYVAPFWFALVAAGYLFARSRGARHAAEAPAG